MGDDLVPSGSVLKIEIECAVPTVPGPFRRTITLHTAAGPLAATLHGDAIPSRGQHAWRSPPL